jgi:hypothetical protein
MMLMAEGVGPCRITKIHKGEAMRTKSIEGEALMKPTIGESFYIRAAVLDPSVKAEADDAGTPCGRLFNTSPLVEILEEGDSRFTLVTGSGSKYMLELLDKT